MLAIAQGWELEVQRGPDWLLVRAKSGGDQTSDALPLADEIWDLLQRHFTYRLVLELDQVELLDSHLIGQLVRLYKRIAERDGVMRLCGLSAYNLDVLRTCRLDECFQPYPDRKEAILAPRSTPQPR